MHAIDWIKREPGIQFAFFTIHGKDGRLVGIELFVEFFSHLEEKTVKAFDGVNFVDQMRLVIIDTASTFLGQR